MIKASKLNIDENQIEKKITKKTSRSLATQLQAYNEL